MVTNDFSEGETLFINTMNLLDENNILIVRNYVDTIFAYLDPDYIEILDLNKFQI